jgi:Flp pilus assembly protein TadD
MKNLRSQSSAGCAALCALALALPAALFADPAEDDPQASQRDPDYAAGKRAMENKNWPQAASSFQQAALRDPANADLQNYLGFVHRKLERFDLAFKHYKRALELSPRHRGAHEYIGEAYLLVGDLANAQKHLAALREICLLPCEEYKDLKLAVDAYRSRATK